MKKHLTNRVKNKAPQSYNKSGLKSNIEAEMDNDQTGKNEQITPTNTNHLAGLSSEEAARRLVQYGPNVISEEKKHPILSLLQKFWGPVPWMLEITVILEIYLSRYVEALVIGILIVFNAILSFIQENRAQGALALLRKQLTVQSRVKRDGQWQLVPAQNLVPGDLIHLRMGDLIPADTKLMSGHIQMDQSALTGESAPVEGEAGQIGYAGAVVKRGEADGEVTATGSHTSFGKTAELVRTAKTASHLSEIVFSIVKYLIYADVFLAVFVVAYALITRIGWPVILPYALILLVASVPVALPATFTLATALGAAELVRNGVLVTRLSAIEEAAAMTILASDKTGTLTENRLTLGAVHPYGTYTNDDVLRWGVLASEEATQDPLDIAILNAAKEKDLKINETVLHFTPFDPASKRSEALVRKDDGSTMRVTKGAPQTIASLSGSGDGAIEQDVANLADNGYRVLAVATTHNGDSFQLAGLLGLQDIPRPDSKELINELNGLGVRVLMITGDDPRTAKAIASQVGISGELCEPDTLHGEVSAKTMECNIFAGVFPEDKFHLVEAIQSTGGIVGMTGDGVNDAPALKQAEVGIAVSSATDVAKAAASLVLTTPGLSNILSAVETSRRIYQRMLTYTLNKIIKTFQVALFLSIGFLISKEFVVTPLLVVLLLFANDFVTMSISTDNVSYSNKPDRWQIRTLIQVAFILSIPVLLLSFGFFFVANNVLHLPIAQMQTLMFVMLVFTGQANVYLMRERRSFWKSFPSRWMLLGTTMDVIVITILATQGLLMAAIPLSYILLSLLAIVIFFPLVDGLKIAVFKYAHMA
jgi:H+-transporting ATPase